MVKAKVQLVSPIPRQKISKNKKQDRCGYGRRTRSQTQSTETALTSSDIVSNLEKGPEENEKSNNDNADVGCNMNNTRR